MRGENPRRRTRLFSPAAFCYKPARDRENCPAGAERSRLPSSRLSPEQGRSWTLSREPFVYRPVYDRSDLAEVTLVWAVRETRQEIELHARSR